MATRVFLIHWSLEELDALRGALTAAGLDVVGSEAEDGARAASAISAAPPEAVLISLRRLPSHGRETAKYLRSQSVGRDIPILFFDGAPDKIEATRAAVPDAEYLPWEELPARVRAL